MKIRPHTHCVCQQALKQRKKKKNSESVSKNGTKLVRSLLSFHFFPESKRKIGFSKLLFIKFYDLNIISPR